MAAAQAVLTSAVFLLSIRRGEGGLSPADMLMITLAGGGVIGWIVTDEPVIATACVVAADLIGAAMMVPKTYAILVPRRWRHSRWPASAVPSPPPSARKMFLKLGIISRAQLPESVGYEPCSKTLT